MMDAAYETQLAAFKRRVGAKDDETELLEDMYKDAIQSVLDYTNLNEFTEPLLIAAKRLAVVMYNQQTDEGETARQEGGVSRTFESGIPGSIRSSLARYRLANVRRF